MWPFNLLTRTASQQALHRFQTLMDTAHAVASINPRGLVDLVRAILRPMQSEYLLGVAEAGRDALPSLGQYTFFGDAVRSRLFSVDEHVWRGQALHPAGFRISLARDPVLPCSWHPDRYISALATIGANKAGPEGNSRSQGAFRQDSNHTVSLWLPWGIGFVTGGNHSITAGILHADGHVIPQTVYDMGYLFDEIVCDGSHYRDQRSGKILAPVEDVRRAAVFEIGRLMRHHDVLPFNDPQGPAS